MANIVYQINSEYNNYKLLDIDYGKRRYLIQNIATKKKLLLSYANFIKIIKGKSKEDQVLNILDENYKDKKDDIELDYVYESEKWLKENSKDVDDEEHEQNIKSNEDSYNELKSSDDKAKLDEIREVINSYEQISKYSKDSGLNYLIDIIKTILTK